MNKPGWRRSWRSWRARLLRPEAFCWRWRDPATLMLSFSLPASSYATAVVRELLDVPADIAH